MYSCERLGDNITEFRYASADGGGLARRKGAWTRAAVAVTGASLFVQALESEELGWLGSVGLGFILTCLACSLARRSPVRQESLLVVRDLGVQITTEYADGRKKSTFLDTARIRAIIINEGITMHRVVFYLAFIVEGSDKMVVAFENLKPRLDTLVKIYRGAREVMFEEGVSREAHPDGSGIKSDKSMAADRPVAGDGSGHANDEGGDACDR